MTERRSMSPNFQPVLKSERVTLRPVRKSDWAGMYKVGSNPTVWAGHTQKDRYQEDVFRTFFNDAIISGSALSILDNETGRIIGSSRYHDYRPELSEVEIGWTFLSTEYWGGTYNAEIKRLMLAHAFSFLDVVVFWVAVENIRSQKAMAKIGGVLRDGIIYREEKEDITPYVVFEIRKKDFPLGPLNT